MKYKTITFDANRPIAQQIMVPTNSEYAVGLKITRDGETVDLSASELSVDGQTHIATNGSYNLFKLSSDGYEGMKKLDVAVNKAGEGLTTNFKLQVVQKDMGYIENESLEESYVDQQISAAVTMAY